MFISVPTLVSVPTVGDDQRLIRKVILCELYHTSADASDPAEMAEPFDFRWN